MVATELRPLRLRLAARELPRLFYTNLGINNSQAAIGGRSFLLAGSLGLALGLALGFALGRLGRGLPCALQ